MRFFIISISLILLFSACKNTDTEDSCNIGDEQYGDIICGLNNEGFNLQICNFSGEWIETRTCSGVDICVNDTNMEGTTVCNGTGVLIQDCIDGQWVDSTVCEFDPCTEGETQAGSNPCGLNNEGFYQQLCNQDGIWENSQECSGTDICINQSTQDGTTPCHETGVLIQDCTNGQWVDSANCTVGGCIENTTVEGTVECGLNSEGYYYKSCNSDGEWEETTECSGTDLCINTSTDATPCGDGNGLQDILCSDGSWSDVGVCNCNISHHWNGSTCAPDIIIDWCDVVDPQNYTISTDAITKIHAQISGTIDGTVVTAQGSELTSIKAMICYDDGNIEVCNDALYNSSCTSCGELNDEYSLEFSFVDEGSYQYYAKFSGDMGITWTQCQNTYDATAQHSCDLSGYTLQQENSTQSLTLPDGLVIPPGGFLILGRNAPQSEFETHWGFALETQNTYIDSADSFVIIDGEETYLIFDSKSFHADGPTAPITNDHNMQKIDTFTQASQSTAWIDEYLYDTATPALFLGNLSNDSGVVFTEVTDASPLDYSFIEIYCDKSCTTDATRLKYTGCGANDDGSVIQTCDASRLWVETSPCILQD
jgi:hypothetical protein